MGYVKDEVGTVWRRSLEQRFIERLSDGRLQIGLKDVPMNGLNFNGSPYMEFK